MSHYGRLRGDTTVDALAYADLFLNSGELEFEDDETATALSILATALRRMNPELVAQVDAQHWLDREMAFADDEFGAQWPSSLLAGLAQFIADYRRGQGPFDDVVDFVAHVGFDATGDIVVHDLALVDELDPEDS